jgi:predicted lipoprotein with Yx(FWY)xxD motif
VVPTTTVPTTPPTTAPPFYEVSAGSVAGLGTVLFDGQVAHTLYTFEPDRQSGKSTCYDECENLWAPLLLVGGIKAPLAGVDVKPSLLGTPVHRWP